MIARRETSGTVEFFRSRPERAKAPVYGHSVALSVRGMATPILQTFHIWLLSLAAPPQNNFTANVRATFGWSKMSDLLAESSTHLDLWHNSSFMSVDKEIINNRQAYHEFFILDTYEAGAALLGTEVKSIMLGRIQLKESFVQIKDGEVWLLGAHISHYSHGNINNHDVLRPRKMLLHRKEIEKLERETTIKGMTLVVTRIYWKNGRIKFEIGVAKGKKLYDKRETEMKKAIAKDTQQQLKERLR